MPRDTSTLNRALLQAFSLTMLCLMAATPGFAQAAPPPGAPQTAPTTVKGTPAPDPALPSQQVPMHQVPVLSQPVTTVPQTRGFLGLSYTPHTDANGRPDGEVVAEIVPGGPAAQGGIQIGDLVTALNGQPIDERHDLASLVAAQTPGATVQLAIRRSGNPQTLTVQIGRADGGALGQNNRPYSADTDYGPPPFSGTYRGKFRAVYLPGTGVIKPQTGFLTLAITPGGAVTGNIHTDSGGLDGTVAGTLSSLGHASLAFTFTQGTSGTMAGLLGLTPGGRLAGTLTQSFGPSPSGTLTWDAGK